MSAEKTQTNFRFSSAASARAPSSAAPGWCATGRQSRASATRRKTRSRQRKCAARQTSRGRLRTVRRITRPRAERTVTGRVGCTLRDGAWCFGSPARDAESRTEGIGPRGFHCFNGHDTHLHHAVVQMPGAMRPSRPRCARERGAPERAQWLAPRADPRACSALRVRPRTATRAPCPCTPRERIALCLTGDRHARMGLRWAPTRRGEAPPTHRRSRIQPRGRAPCTVH